MLSLRVLVLRLIEKEMLFEIVSMTAPILDIKSIPKIQGTCNWSIKRQLWNWFFFLFKTNSKLKQPFCFSSVPPAPQSLMDGDLAALLPLCQVVFEPAIETVTFFAPVCVSVQSLLMPGLISLTHLGWPQ